MYISIWYPIYLKKDNYYKLKSTKDLYQVMFCYDIVGIKIMIFNEAIAFYSDFTHTSYLILRWGLWVKLWYNKK